MTSQEQKLAVIIVCLLTVTWILYVVSNAVPSWGKATISSSISTTRIDHTYGLWQYCISDICVTVPNTCYSADGGLCSKLFVTRAFITLACIVVPFAIGCFIFILITKLFRSSIILLGQIFTFASFIFGIIATGVGISYFSGDILFFMGPAAIVCIVADILNLIAGIMTCFIHINSN